MSVQSAPARPAPWHRLDWGVDAIMATAFVLLTLTVWRFIPARRPDARLMEFAAAHQVGWLESVANALWYLGDGTRLSYLAGALALVVAIKRRSFQPLFLMLAAWLLPSAVIGSLKVVMDRGAPRSGEIRFWEVAGGVSFPSGHASNCVTWFSVLAILLWLMGAQRLARVLWLAVPVLFVILLGAMVYLRFHWFTDGLASCLASGLIVRQLARIFGQGNALGVLVRIPVKIRNLRRPWRFGSASQP